jgi:hypothetical protein
VEGTEKSRERSKGDVQSREEEVEQGDRFRLIYLAIIRQPRPQLSVK